MKTREYLRSVRLGRAYAMALMLLFTVCAWSVVFYLASHGSKEMDSPHYQFWQIVSYVTTLSCVSMAAATIFRLLTGQYLLSGEETAPAALNPRYDDTPIPVNPEDPRSANLTPQQRSLQSVFNHVAKTGEIATGTIDEEGFYHLDEEDADTPT